MTLYRKLIRPMHCYPGHNYEPLTEPIEKEEKWYPEEEREHLEKKYASYNEGSFSDLVFEKKYVPVVRCKDCKWGLLGEKDIVCMKTTLRGLHEPDWFCADGERQKGGDENA